MRIGELATRLDTSLPWLLLSYGAASLFHFSHNAEFLADYPNLPAWLSRSQVYAAWIGMSALGASGYVLQRTGHELAGLTLMGLYAALGFDGVLHYSRAPMDAHSATMNLTIWLEVVAAAVLLAVVTALTARLFLTPRSDRAA
jgi:hypothetical protein